jgi:hypothetical protein
MMALSYEEQRYPLPVFSWFYSVKRDSCFNYAGLLISIYKEATKTIKASIETSKKRSLEECGSKAVFRLVSFIVIDFTRIFNWWYQGKM